MPFTNNSELPDSVRKVLPISAQNIYRRAYNAADKSDTSSTESSRAKIAWSAVKNAGFKKGDSGKWIKESICLDFVQTGASWINGTVFYKSIISKESVDMSLEFPLEHYSLSNNLNLLCIKEENDKYIIESFAFMENYSPLKDVVLSYNPDVIEEDMNT